MISAVIVPETSGPIVGKGIECPNTSRRETFEKPPKRPIVTNIETIAGKGREEARELLVVFHGAARSKERRE